MIDYIPAPDEPIGEIGGVSAWDALHPERQLTFDECETEFEHAQRVADLHTIYNRRDFYDDID